MIDLLTIGEVAAQLRCSRMSIYRLVRRGALEAIRVGSHYRIRRQALEEFLQRGGTAA